MSQTPFDLEGDRGLLQDRYQIVQLLGRGRFTQTFLAIDQAQTPARECVIQQFSIRGSDAPLASSSQTFFQPQLDPTDERVQTLGNHPQIPTLLDRFAQDNDLYLTQEYLPGKNLAALLIQTGTFNATDIWQILENLLPVLHFIHSLGLVHRDIKPENIIRKNIPSANQLALVDFSTAQWLPPSPLSPSHPLIGSPEYAAPEQLQGKATFASDLYSLGVTCVHLLTGIHPFNLMDKTNLDRNEQKWAWQDYWSPSIRLGSIHRSRQDYDHRCLAQMLNRLIAPDLNSRFSSAAEAIATLETLKHKKLPLHPPPSSSPWKYQTTLTGHQGLFASVNAVTINANSQILASTSDDKTIRLWDLATGRARLVLQGHSQTVKAIAIHPNNPDPINDQHFQLLLASGSSDRTIKLWNGQNGQEIATLTGHLQTVNTLAFSPDGQTLASGSADKTIKLWHWQTGNLLATLTGHTLAVNALAYGILGSDGGNDFSANATTPGRSLSLLASASTDRTIRLWDGTTYELLRILRDHIQVVRAIAFHPTGKLLATGGEDKTIRLWDTTSGQRIGILSGHSWSISGLAFSPDGKILISSSWDKTLKLWQLHLDQAKINPKVTGTEIAVLKGHTDSVTCVAISPNGTAIASGSRDQTIRLWQLAAKP